MNTNEKLRDGLETIIKRIDEAIKTDNAQFLTGALLHIRETAKGMLALPRRNCDVGSVEEQYARFKKWCEGEFYKRPMNPLTGEPCKSCPCYSVSANGVDGCNYLRWAQMPYEKEGEA